MPNRLNKYSIRKFKVGTASILIGSMLFLGNEVQAVELENGESNVAEVNVEEVSNQETNTEVTEEALETSEGETASTAATEETVATENSVGNEVAEEKQETAEVAEPRVRLFAETTGVNVADKVNITNLNIQNKKDSTTVDPNQSGSLTMGFTLDSVDPSVKEGDYFEIQLSDNLNFHGDTEVTAFYPPNFVNGAGAIVATGTYDVENHKYVYTFTDYVENSLNVKGSAYYPLFVDRKNVPYPTDQVTFSVTVAGETASTTLDVAYTASPELVDSFITESNPVKNTFKQVIYVNPKHDSLMDTILAIRADDWNSNTGSVATLNENNTTFKAYRVPAGSNPDFPFSFGVDFSKYAVTDVYPEYGIDEDGVEFALIRFGNNTVDGTGYIVVLESDTTGEDGNLTVSAQVRTSNRDSYSWTNQNVFEVADADIEAERYQLGDYVWEDKNKNGIQDEGEVGVEGVKVTLTKPNGETEVTYTNEDGNYIFSELLDGEYTITFETPKGYQPTIIKGGDDQRFDSDGNTVNVTIEGKNNYTIDFGVYNEMGEFQEHHIYTEITKDFDGNVIDENTVVTTDDKEVTSGTEEEAYTTQGQPKEGFKLVNVSGTDETNFNADGTPATGNYESSVKKEVTYEYEKVNQPGRFNEEHYYYIEKVDKEGNVLETIRVDEETIVKDTLEDFPGAGFTAGLINKEGFTYRPSETTSEINGQVTTIDTETGEVSGDYVSGESQKVVYNYYKQEVVEDETPPVDVNGTFQEHHKYTEVIKDFDGNETERIEVETIDGEESKGGKDETYTTGAKPKDGFELVKVEGSDQAKFDQDGKTTEGNYIPGKKEEVFYEYEKVRQPGRFEDTHRYFIEKVDKNGNVIGVEEVEDMRYTYQFQEDYPGASQFETMLVEKDGFKYRNTSDRDLADNSYVDEKTGATKGEYVAGKLQKVTFNYYKQVVVESPEEETGNFQEHHKYTEITKDFDGNIIEEETKVTTEDKEVTTGTKDDTYTTKEEPKEGFELVGVKGSEGSQFNENGTPTSGNYVPGKDLEVTYEYEKVNRPGRFEDTHRYFIEKVDKNGKVIEVIEVTDLGHTNKFQEGFAGKDQFTAQLEEKDGFKFRNTSDHKLADEGFVDEATGMVTGDYLAGEMQGITYNYFKQEVVEDEKPEQPETPEQPEKPGKEDEPKDPADKGTAQKPSTPEKKLPKTGEQPMVNGVAVAASLLAGIGLVFISKLRKDQ